MVLKAERQKSQKHGQKSVVVHDLELEIESCLA